ncbi:MAG: hypothetical protein SWQ30_13585 [Thermodesulfobacteriota bacterium]|nr:hypothetical protein [Thermodesulfobacteriota bacterium]
MGLMRRIGKHGIILVSLLFLTGIMNCCGARKQAKAPEALIKDYIGKHETMVDLSLADLYIEKEQKSITGKINLEIEERKHAGTLQKMQHASFDFSSLKINLVDQKKEYVDDEPRDFLRVAASGSIIMKTDKDLTNIPVDEVIILEKEGKSWKVTETINPWG